MSRGYIQDAQAVSTFSTRVYGWMSIGLAVTAFIAYTLFRTGLYVKLIPFYWLLMLGTFGIGMGINMGLRSLSIGGVIGLFLAYSGVQGVLFGTLLPAFAAAYGGQVIWSAFLTASALFGLVVGYGIFTKNDLTGLGRILSLGLIGLIVVTFIYMILSFFISMPLAYLLISYLGLAIFVGLTAYDAQTIRQFSMQADVHSVASYKLSMVMALKMYINVIMIFWYLLMIFSSGGRRS